ncbi:similar to Saccharomyces cerevisiae YOR045W TOM6 Component of the TOM (translocase of outer membrane) complex responsible for recognition and initial import steps for all directed proteins [Geotrichum candidum]|uniref:Similar to Saccharomyces cerevisiae YOR045W TOM6 Component of the TOM (Translocase of outer membrane) complex responsible for recognition and initial import steps for all directed proteins n=1 Tax=Geotrichum candidum TaxID=1173061 RepID=A0A0J9X9F2_GEOCN|nr:similar to Saccharomyces cerevisiae YOR045W TOM6 Component of the TOM (translocase of outer membrane) complex responsible for recognition and initial import steps for all directed proteins [Geotrichum candidum]
MASSEPTISDAITQLAVTHASKILLTVGLFTAGVLFIKSPIMDNMAPQL